VKFSFTKKYILALSIIALFGVIAFMILTTNISNQKNDAKLLNIGGKQRMLSQKIILHAIKNQSKDLQETVASMEFYHKQLISIEMSEELKKIYFSKPVLLDAKLKEYLNHANRFISHSDGDSLSFLLENSDKILKTLDYAVSRYQLESEEKIDNLLNIESYILLLIFLTLIAEAYFIFRPINNSVEKKTQEILDEKEYSDMITQINTNAIIAVNEKLEILTFNKSAEDIFGFSADEMLYTKLNDDRIVPTKYLNQHTEALTKFMQSSKLKNKSPVFELEGQHKNKNIFPIRISFGVKIEKDSKIVVANIQDISKEKDKDSLINNNQDSLLWVK
jgi:PAS domain S-box-containing protein